MAGSAPSNIRQLRQDLGELARGIAAWWIAELSALLPEKAVYWLTDAGFRTLLLVADGDAVQLLLRDPSGQTLASVSVANGASLPTAIAGLLDQFGLARQSVPLGLQLPRDSFFVREFALPREVGRSVQTVALHDLLKKTPLRQEDIHLAHAVRNSGGRLHVTQTVVRRKYIEAGAASLGIDLQDLAFVEMAGRTDGSNLIRLQKNPAEKPWLARLVLSLAATLFALGLVAFAVQYRQQQARLDELADRLVSARAQAQAVRATLDAANLQISTANQLRSRKRDGVRLLRLWEELSRVLPSDSWVSELRMSKGEKNTLKITLTGFSSAAANLVGIVDQSPLFHSVSLTAPIAIDPVEQRERFVLQAMVDDRPGEKLSR